jgi:uncharacterized integral membrane protein (TIGR00698 family)
MTSLGPLGGVLLVAALAVLARFASHFTGPIPDVVVGLAGGALLGNVWAMPAAFKAGIRFVLHYVLRAAIVLFGLGLSFAAVERAGLKSLVLIGVCFVVAIALGFVTARLFKLNATIGPLLGSGTAICGGSAILAIGPIVRAKDEEIAYALGTIFTFNALALLVYPPLGHALGMSDVAFGSWTGTAVNDTSVVVATGYAYSHAAGDVATIVKLTRTVLLVPLALAIAYRQAQSGEAPGSLWTRVRATIPWFVLYFVAAVALRSSGVLPGSFVAAAETCAGFLILMVLVAVGLNTDVRQLGHLGARPLVAGLLLATVMSLVSFSLVSALGIR